MKLILRAGGVIRKGPERELVDDYIERAQRLSRNLGISQIQEQQVDLRGAKSRKAETEILLPPNSDKSAHHYVILDERGKTLTSPQIAAQIASWRDEGYRQVSFVIGGADGFEPDALPSPLTNWALGSQTWPHKLVRVMLAEQVYRALSILASTPYHRE